MSWPFNVEVEDRDIATMMLRLEEKVIGITWLHMTLRVTA